jgi:hypothetical protein
MVGRGFALAGMFLGMAVLSLGCGSGYSEEKAKIQCDQERAANASACVTDAVYEQCLSCYQECGNDCVRAESCPASYACSDGSGGERDERRRRRQVAERRRRRQG